MKSSPPRTLRPVRPRPSPPYRGSDGRWYVSIDEISRTGSTDRRFVSARTRRGLRIHLDEWRRNGQLPPPPAVRVRGATRRTTRAVRASAAVLCAAALIGAGLGVDHSASAGTRATQPTRPRRRASAVRDSPPNLLAIPAITRYLSTRTSVVTMALYDADTGITYSYDPQLSEQTASVIKLSILATLLLQHQQSATALDPVSVELATSMIEHSSDTAATQLWTKIGGDAAVGRYDKALGLSDTTLGTKGFWGESTSSAADQVRVMRSLVYPSPVLDPSSQLFAFHLMQNLETDQRWGISAGVPTGVTVALKNGWVPLTSYYDWQVNSVGWVDGDGRNYVLAVLSDHNDGEQYGIDTIQGVAPLVWSELGPPPTPGAG